MQSQNKIFMYFKFQANKAQLKIKSTKGEKGKFQKHFDNEFLSGNTLDSSNPTRTRGKQREVKKPKLTNLKKCIIKERILKEKFKEKSLGSFCTEEVNDLINNTDFKTEMKEYIHKLEKNKIPKANKKASKETEIEKKTLEKENNKLNAEAPDIVKETAEKLASHFSPEVTTFVPKKAHFSSKMRE